MESGSEKGLRLFEGIRTDVQGSNEMVDRLGPNPECEWRREIEVELGEGSVQWTRAK
jgi:hypothetical protein